MYKVYRRIKEFGYYAIKCQHCGQILASASESEYLPEFSYCDCDERENKTLNKKLRNQQESL
jgi:phage FluMu protein Com